MPAAPDVCSFDLPNDRRLSHSSVVLSREYFACKFFEILDLGPVSRVVSDSREPGEGGGYLATRSGKLWRTSSTDRSRARSGRSSPRAYQSCRLPHHVIGGLLVAFLAVAIRWRLRDAAPETIERTQRSRRGQGGLGGNRFRRLQACVHDRSQVSGSRTGWRNRRGLGGGDDNLGRAGLGRCGRVALASWHSLARDSRRADPGSRRGALGNRRWVAGLGWGRGLGDGRWIVLGPSLRTRSSGDPVGLPPEVVADRPPGNVHQNQLNYDDRDPKQPLPTHRHFPLGEVNDLRKHRHVTQKQGPGRLRRLSQPDLRAVKGCCIVESPVFTRSFQSQSCRLWSPGRAPDKQ